MTPTEQDVEALWADLFGGPPPIKAAPGLLLDILVRHMPLAPPYEPRSARRPIHDHDRTTQGRLAR